MKCPILKALVSNYNFYIQVSCSSTPQEITDMFGTLSTPTLQNEFIYDANCTWIIRAPLNYVIDE